MTMLTDLTEAYVYGKRLVRVGDTVKLLPLDLRKGIKKVEHFDFLRKWLGNGPFTISSIGQWPCGKTMLYLKGAKGDNPGARASDFM